MAVRRANHYTKQVVDQFLLFTLIVLCAHEPNFVHIPKNLVVQILYFIGEDTYSDEFAISISHVGSFVQE